MTISLASPYRSHTCADLSIEQVDQNVTLSGWIHRKRDHGSIAFIDLRDNYGVTQVVLDQKLRDELSEVRVESVITVHGTVIKRADGLANSKLKTGQIEIKASEIKVISRAEVLPFQIADQDNAPEATRLEYRFLELRREKLHADIILRSKVIKSIRDSMNGMGFHEFQTPILTSSSPEGARDYLVPSRIHPGKFFALPQAPQQFKQLLMVAGFDRYFQIAPCFRDENPRADRSPGEFYQCDLEMSFVDQESVFKVGEQLMVEVFRTFSDRSVTAAPFPRIAYLDALRIYGTDKPDLRNPLIIDDVTNTFRNTEFKVFRSEIERLGVVRAISVTTSEVPSRKYFDTLIEQFKETSGRGLGYIISTPDEVKGSLSKVLSPEELSNLRKTFGKDDTKVIFFAAGPEKEVGSALGKLRTQLGKDFKVTDENQFSFVWVVDFPLYEFDDETRTMDFCHNPFSMPDGGLEALTTKPPLEVRAFQYDIVCNGHEFCSGAIRNQDPAIMYKAFEIVGHSKEVVDERFGGMIKAFQYGAPPHGGMAFGVDRIVMLLSDNVAIRDVITFPLAQTVEDLMMGAPSVVSDQQLRDVHIEVKLPPKAV